MRERLFDDELYYRISENTIYIPSLRQNKKVLHKLLINSMEFFKGKYGNEGLTFDDECFEALLAYKWPGKAKSLIKVMDCIAANAQVMLPLKILPG